MRKNFATYVRCAGATTSTLRMNGDCLSSALEDGPVANVKFTISIAMSDPSHYGPIAEAAESLGYDAVVLPDSIFFSDQVSAPYPYTEDGKRMRHRRSMVTDSAKHPSRRRSRE